MAVLQLTYFGFAQNLPASGTTPFVLDGNRMYAELSFVRPDGSIHRALAFADLGSPSMVITAALFKELHIDQGTVLSFRIGDLTVKVPAKDVAADPAEPYSVGSSLKVEAVLPARVLQRHEVVLDYQNRKMTLALAGTIKHEGIPVPFRIHPQTGLIAVDAHINGESYPITIDNGSAYTWFRQDAAKPWLVAHADWERGVGAVGAANMMMAGDGAENSGILIRIPEIRVGPLKLDNVGVLAAGESRVSGNQSLFDWYSTKNAVPVIGWMGGNVLKSFRLTIDYPNRTIYWLRQTGPDDDLNQVGLTLKAQSGQYFVAAVSTKNGKATVEGVQVGDKLIRIDSLQTQGATWGQIYNALHGKPGETRVLILKRGTDEIKVPARVTAF